MQLLRQKVGFHLLLATNKQNNRLITPPQTHIAFIMLCPKGIGSRHKSGAWNNQGRQETTLRDNQFFNHKYSHSKSNKLSSPVIYVPPPLNNSVINPPQLYSVFQQSSSSSNNNPCDNISMIVTQIEMSWHHWWYLCLHHWMIQSLIHLSCTRFVKIHPALQRTQITSRKLLQYLVGLHLIRQILCHRRPTRMEVAIFINEWLICLIWNWHNNNSMP